MKKASKFEKVAARCWNLLNEGKPFTPIFTTGVFLLFTLGQWSESSFWFSFLLSLAGTLPLFALCFLYDFPLFLRNYLFIPLVASILLLGAPPLSLWLLAAAVYFFFTVFFWGTLYYHLRIGTTWLNFTRFWKLVLKNSDSTSGNAQEQLPKVFMLLSVWHALFEKAQTGAFSFEDLTPVLYFMIGFGVFAWILHQYLFDWKPAEYEEFTEKEEINAKSDKVIVIVVDGMRKDRFEKAHTPFLNALKEEGTEYRQMETVYPARTVVCFSSMFTGTYPREHGITSNMVWRLGIKVESIFDSLRKAGKKGKLLGIAHLVDAMGSDVETVTAVMKNDVADPSIMKRARQIMENDNPDLLIVQMIATDQTGHSRGVFYDEYLQKINEADQLIEEFVDYLDSEGHMKNTTLIICADHGQADGIGGHGHLDEGERFVPFIMHGPHIRKGESVDEKHSLVSLAPTIAYLLGAPFPENSRGPVLKQAIKEGGEI